IGSDLSYLITFEKHEEWLTTSPKTRPQNGSMILYNRKKVKYRKDGYCWKKRKDGKTTREDHMKLKVQGVENPDIVLVHYLNVPAIEDCGKPCGPILCSINTDKKEWAKWTKEELIGQLKPMFHGIKWTCSNGNSSSGFSVEQLVQQILDSHQTKPPPRTHNCLCTGTLGSSVHHKCNSAKHRIISPKVDPRGGYSSGHSEVQNNDVSEGKTEHSSHGGGGGGGGKSSGGGGGSAREKRNGKVHKPYRFGLSISRSVSLCVYLFQGGVKVLITGPWQEASSNYNCLFDQVAVPASLIQPGVLRCYCPAHDTGLVTLQVTASNQIISNSVVFEYKARALPSLPSSQHDWLSLDDNQFRMSILERLEQMERRMAEMVQGQEEEQEGQAGSSFESRVVVVCEKMMNRACWAKSKHLIHSKTFRGMTLLHLAAGQGYATLIQTLIKWRTKHADSIDLELEVDPLNVDHFSCTPLMWACALGHLEAAVVLYKWDRRALAIPDSLGRLPLSIARSRGHTKLAECLEQLQREEQQPPAPLPPTTRMSFSPTPHDAPTSDSWMVTWGFSSRGLGRKGSGDSGGSSLGKEKLASRLRQREQLGNMLVMAEREMVDTELFSYREDLENQDCMTQMDDLQYTQSWVILPLQDNMMTLAEHIIEATPERIKRETFVALDGVPLDSTGVSNTMSWLASYLGDVDLSPGGSPLREGPMERPTLPSPADWSEFIQASNNKVERDLAQLTLSDPEQRELYEAARLVQTAFRKYKGRPFREQQEVAATVIQRCYKKYKQVSLYALYKKMTQAAILIQSKFRSYHEQKKFQQSRRAAVLIQQYYRSYKEFGSVPSCLVCCRSSLLAKRQDQAARKIMRFLRRCRHR
uniref:Calmodulin-binding transcription activator 1 n=1 Tax=Hucho hucho TaxID=62062 RepID=A0A4W5LY80_9TELE